MEMPLHVSLADMALRLILTLVAGGLLGLNRGSRGHAAGFRTTILVALAAAVAMIQANLLLPVGGKAADSFSTMDVMRFPLGILTGVGFIGGGTILKRGELVTGVTTAATLWIATAIGLCFGGGQLILGIGATALGAFTLWGLKPLDDLIPRRRRALVAISTPADAAPLDLTSIIAGTGCHAEFRRRSRSREDDLMTSSFEITWRSPGRAAPPTNLIAALDAAYTVTSVQLESESNH